VALYKIFGDRVPSKLAYRERSHLFRVGLKLLSSKIGLICLSAYRWDWSNAEREYKRGLELNASSAYGHSRFGWFLSWLGRFDEGVAEAKRGLELNPVGPVEFRL